MQIANEFAKMLFALLYPQALFMQDALNRGIAIGEDFNDFLLFNGALHWEAA